MYPFQIVTWLLFGLSLAMIHTPLIAHRPGATVLAGMAGGLGGGLLVRALSLPPISVLGYSMTGLALAVVGAEVLIVLSSLRSRVFPGGHHRMV